MEARKEQESKPSSKALPNPRSCRGRGQVYLGEGQFREAEFDVEVLHIFDGALDVALLLVQGPSAGPPFIFEPMPWHRGPPLEAGTEVLAVGHGLFGPGTAWCGPSVTLGTIAKVAVNARSGRAAVLQSSAAVHRGCSGGALVEAATGRFVGLVTTNVKQQDGTIMPHVNFSLPVELLSPFMRFVQIIDERWIGGNPSNSDWQNRALQLLPQFLQECAADEYEQALWRLEPDPMIMPSWMEQRKQHAMGSIQELSDEKIVDGADVSSQQCQHVCSMSPLLPLRSAL